MAVLHNTRSRENIVSIYVKHVNSL